MNLIPNKIPDTGSYWCTWETQCNLRGGDGEKGKQLQNRDYLNDELLFGENSYLNILDGMRQDVILLIDAGWDIGVNKRGREQYGSMVPNAERFPSLQGTPAQKLRTLVERVEKMGFRGLGLWVAVHTPYEGTPRPVAQAVAEDRAHWEEAARWCHEAGVAYWKVDLGSYQHESSYREMMSEAARKYAPNLKVEHAIVGQWLFYPHPGHEHWKLDETTPEHPNEEETQAWLSAYTRRVLPISDYLRTYDVAYEVKYSCTLQRVARSLQASDGLEGPCAILSVEDTEIIGAGLGCAIGAMRHERERQFHPQMEEVRPIIETIRALRWQRIAPPFAVNRTPYAISEKNLLDTWYYPERDTTLPPWVSDLMAHHIAPATIARNMPLPKVKADDEKPFVICSTQPDTNALSVAAVPRTLVNQRHVTPEADITVQCRYPDAPIGLFGRWRTMNIVFDQPAAGHRVWAQDLASDTAVDITAEVELNETGLTVPFAALAPLMAEEDREIAQPGFVLQIMN